MKITPLRLFLLTFICSVIASITFSVIFFTVQHLDNYYNPKPVAPEIRKIE